MTTKDVTTGQFFAVKLNSSIALQTSSLNNNTISKRQIGIERVDDVQSSDIPRYLHLDSLSESRPDSRPAEYYEADGFSERREIEFEEVSFSDYENFNQMNNNKKNSSSTMREAVFASEHPAILYDSTEYKRQLYKYELKDRVEERTARTLLEAAMKDFITNAPLEDNPSSSSEASSSDNSNECRCSKCQISINKQEYSYNLSLCRYCYAEKNLIGNGSVPRMFDKERQAKREFSARFNRDSNIKSTRNTSYRGTGGEQTLPRRVVKFQNSKPNNNIDIESNDSGMQLHTLLKNTTARDVGNNSTNSNNNNNQQQRRSINENTNQLISMLKKQVLMQKKRADAADSEVVKLQKRINVLEEQLSRKFSIDTLSVESIWSEMIDPDTGEVFYMNEETGEMRIADDDENEYNKELDEL